MQVILQGNDIVVFLSINVESYDKIRLNYPHPIKTLHK